MFQGNHLAIIPKHVTSLCENMCDTCEDVDYINQLSQLESPVHLAEKSTCSTCLNQLDIHVINIS